MTTATRSRNLVPDTDDSLVTIEFRLEGVAPLLMHAPTLIDPIAPLTKEIAKITSKKASQRTIADVERLTRLEWEAGLYHDEKLGPYVPASNIKQVLRGAAGRWKLGAPIARGLTFEHRRLPVEYDGPRDKDGLYEAGYVSSLPVKNGGFNAGRVMRARPMFEEWAIEGRAFLDPHEVGLEDLGLIFARAQRMGVGDYRPEYGLFTATVTVADDDR